MGKPLRKAQARLARRIKEFDEQSKTGRRNGIWDTVGPKDIRKNNGDMQGSTHRRPGSMKLH
jgi:hypothetical protein